MIMFIKTVIRKMMFFAFSFFEKQNKCLVLSPHIPIQNLGDQALLLGALQGVERFPSVFLVRTGTDSCAQVFSDLRVKNANVRVIDDLQMAFATSMAFWESMKLYALSARCSNCFVIGADVLDGTYNEEEVKILFEHIEFLTRLGVKVTILGSSFSKRISDSTVKGLCSVSKKVKVFARDAFSLSRITPYCEASLSADVAFLMQPIDPVRSYPATKACSAENTGISLTIGVCIKEDEFNSEMDSKKFIESLILLSTRFRLKLIALPHHQKDFVTLKRIFSYVDDSKVEVELPTILPFAPEIKGKAATCDLVVTGRMHVAIASLDQGVPVICYSYGDKFKGLLKHFNLPYDVLVIEDKNPDLELVLNYCIDNLSSLAKTVNDNLGEVQFKSRLNFN